MALVRVSTALGAEEHKVGFPMAWGSRSSADEDVLRGGV